MKGYTKRRTNGGRIIALNSTQTSNDIIVKHFPSSRQRQSSSRLSWQQEAHYLQALRVPVVHLLAGIRAGAGSRALPSISATLAIVLSHTGATRATSSGSGRSRLRGGGGSAAGVRATAVEGRADGADLDVGVDDGGVGVVGLDIGGGARGDVAGTTGDTGGGGCASGRVVAVEPEHVGRVVIPQGHDEDHALGERSAHALQAAVLGEDVLVLEQALLGGAVVVGDGVAADAGPGRLGVGDHLAVLHVEALDLLEGAAGGAVVGDELGDDGELALGVDGHARTVEGLVALAEGVEITSVGVAGAAVAVGAVGATAGVAAAHHLAGGVAGVRSEGRGDAVGLPDIHLRAAGAVVASTRIGIIGGGLPSINVGLTVDELEVARALRVTVPSTVLGTGLVGWVLGHATVGVHGDKVQSAVETAGEVGDVDIKGELLVQQLKHLVGGVVLHHVQTRANVLLLAGGDEVEAEGVAAGSHTISGLVAGTLEGAVGCARRIVRADGLVPGVAGVAVGVVADFVHPTPVGIDDHLAVVGGAAAASSAALPGHGRMHFRLGSTDLLSLTRAQKGGQDECGLVHAVGEGGGKHGDDCQRIDWVDWLGSDEKENEDSCQER